MPNDQKKADKVFDKIKAILLICTLLVDIREEVGNDNPRRRPVCKIYAQLIYIFANEGGIIGDADTTEEKIYVTSRNML